MITKTKKLAVTETPPVKPLSKLERLQYRIDEALRDQTKVDDFLVRFGENPTHALEWSAEVFTAAARVWVGKSMAAWVANTCKNKPDISDDELVKLIMDEALREVLRRAKWPQRSTSVPSNEIELCKTAALADFVDRVMFNAM